ncbi:hypothetical protein DFH06DRAFT_1329648 [Mycena polygramma]|nr:hypothetical protein DFH06DRAFT_1329648 [Mycena polygramma]
MSYYPNNSPRSISRLVDIGPLLRSELQFFAASVIEIDEFQDSQFAHLRYVTEHLRPFGAVIDACIPSSVSSSSNMPAGRVAELAPFVMRYMERVALLYSMALRYSEDNLTSPFLDTRVRWSVTLANKFDMFVGRPNYGFSPETREVFVARIALAGELAHANQDANSILDVPLSAEYLSLPVVPSWNRDRIEELLKREQADPFIGEECFLQDQIMASQGLAHAIQKASDLETEGFSGHPSGRYRVREIVALWINRARHLAQQLHHTTTLATEAEASVSLVTAIREGVAVLLRNMVLLGKTSLDQGEKEKSGVDTNFYVPGEGTALFAMAERFVDSFGYAGDDSPLERAILFENLVTLITTMVRSPDYISKKDDFPRFELSADDRRWYGLFDSTKAYQVTLQHARHVDSHCFGDKLARYNPGLSVEEHYKIPTSPPPDIPTRPNTPETDVIAVDSSVLAVGLEIGKKRAAEDDGRLIDLRRERGLVFAGESVQEGEDAVADEE